MRQALPTLGVLLIPTLLALPAELWLGLGLGLALGVILVKSPLRESFLLFAGIPGLILFVGVSFETETLLATFASWAELSLALLLLGRASSSLAERQRYAPLWLLPLLFLDPSGPVLAGIVLAQLVWTLTRYGLPGDHKTRRGLAVVSVIAVLMLLGISSLDLPQSHTENTPTTVPSEQTGGNLPPESDESLSEPQGPVTIEMTVEANEQPRWFGAVETFSRTTSYLAMIVLAFVLTTAIYAAMRSREGFRSPLRGFNKLLPLLAAWLTLALILLWSILSTDEGGGAGIADSTAAPAPRLGNVDAALTFTAADDYRPAAVLIMAASLLVLAGAIAIVIWWSKILREPKNTRDEDQEDGKSSPAGASYTQVPNRIRLAYKQFLASMKRLGLARRRWESPRSYAARISQDDGLAQGELMELTRLYEAVRYGEELLEHQAARAETLAGKLADHFKQQGIEQHRDQKAGT